MDHLNTLAWRALIRLVAVIALLIFVPAGTLHYWQGWVYLGLFAGASTLVTLDLMRRDRALLARRLGGGAAAEREPAQKTILRLSAAAFAGLLALPALEHRLMDRVFPVAGVLAGDIMVVLGFAVVARVYRENSFASATVQVGECQTLISTGPYAIVRHPMYLGVALCLFGTPLALASLWAFAPATMLVGLMIWRIFDEERVLTAGLAGYTEYRRHVRYRLVPRVW
jgi:protein-S-isoprenylcysteine O-methyltransferase Ste14